MNFIFPESPRSSSSKLSDVSSSPPKLDMSTLAILDNYFSEKAEQERLFRELAAEKAAAEVAGLALEADDEVQDKPMISVADYKLAFGEDWQLSQFWYDEYFANKLASNLHALCDSAAAESDSNSKSPTIAFLCCPTAFVAFQHMKPLRNARLLEYDQRFSILSPRQFFPYDMNEPDVFPEELRKNVDIAVVDPPFLNEETHTKVLQTLRQILHPKSKLVLLTSTSIEDIILRLYDEPPLGPLRRTGLTVEHGRLANDFACWASWEGAEEFWVQAKEKGVEEGEKKKEEQEEQK